MTDTDKKRIPDVLAIVKGYLLINDDTKDTLLTSVISSTGEMIRNYCNFYKNESIPDELRFIWAEIAMAKYKHVLNQYQSGDGIKAGTARGVASVTDGSQSVSYDVSGASDFAGISDGDKDFISGFAYSLNKYKRLRWD